MSNPYPVTPLPPTDGIKDPQMRAFADAMVSAWGLRNGQIGATDAERFITKKEFQGLTTSALAGIFGTGAGAVPVALGPNGEGGIGGAPKISATILVKTLTDSIIKSKLFEELGQQIQLLSVNKAKGIADAAITSERTIRVTKDNALAAAVNRVWAYIGDGGALIEDGQLAAVTPAAALATAWTQVQTALKDPNTGLVSAAAIRSTYETYVSNVDSKMNATYTLRVEIDSAGRQIIGGFGLMATAGAGSPEGGIITAGFRADTFFIGSPVSAQPLADQLANPSAPFIVVTTPQTIGGIDYSPGVYIKTAFIVDATIDAAKLKVASITSAYIQDATITTAKIGGNQVTFPVATSAGGVGLSAAEVTLATASPITISGSTNAWIVVQASMQATNTLGAPQAVFLRVYRNGLLEQQSVTTLTSPGAGCVTIGYGAYCPPGIPQTFEIRAVTSTGGATCDNAFLTAVAYMR